jgi:Phytanoyl-CoA dioxygenase (PhyH)
MVLDIPHLRQFGWMIVHGAVPFGYCERLVDVLENEMGVPVHDPSRWPEYGGEPRDLIPIWGHQAQWDIRQLPDLHRIWTTLLGTERLGVSLDSCRFTPPWQPGDAKPYGIHWDHDPWNAEERMFQGVLALTDTATDQGGFRCVPSQCHDRAGWPRAPLINQKGHALWLANTQGHEIVHVPARAGDLILWDSRLPHGNSKNRSFKPRIAFYIRMEPFPADGTRRRAQVDSWRTGQCVPWWRSRRGYDRIEPWPPATLTELGRRLLGLDEWLPV